MNRDAYEFARSQRENAAAMLVGVVRWMQSAHATPTWAKELVADALDRYARHSDEVTAAIEAKAKARSAESEAA